MTSPNGALGAVAVLIGVGGVAGIDGLAGAGNAAAVSGPNTDFAGMLSKGLESVQGAQSKASDLAVQVANG